MEIVGGVKYKADDMYISFDIHSPHNCNIKLLNNLVGNIDNPWIKPIN